VHVKGCRTVALAGAFAGALFAAPDIAIQRLALHQYEDGPVQPSTYSYLPGETAWFSARITGFASESVPEDERQRRVRLTWRAQVEDPAGTLLQPPKEGRIAETLLPEDKDWAAKFVIEFQIPPFAPAGTYRIPVAVKDEIAGKEIAGQYEFRVRGEPAPEASSLTTRNFRFLAREDDRFGLQPPVYHAGDTLFARFDIVGYKLGEQNRFSVDYGMAIFAGEKQMFAQPEAAQEAGQPFYPQRWVPAGFSLNLDKDVAPGEYTLVITIRDRISSQMEEVRQPFQVR
jgi:hypothetical protein